MVDKYSCLRPGSACAAPVPRGTTEYYSRHHNKNLFDDCKGSCYCPEGCCCPHEGICGRFARPDCCDPNVVMDCCPEGVCPCCICDFDPFTNPCNPCNPCSPCNPCNRCAPCNNPCNPCKPCKPCNPCNPCPPCGPCGSECPNNMMCGLCGLPKPGKMCGMCTPCPPCCDGCCPPYCPPPRKPVCYPPLKCYDTDPCRRERICFCPCPSQPNPKYCTCGMPNPCECDLSLRRRRNICIRSPCCRRCGRKVYAAEKINSAGGAFHTSCFTCYSCHKSLELTSVYEHQGEIYCKICYARHFGVNGYGYGTTLVSPY